jgi:type VI secretion system secreted protein VgrG
MADVRLFIEGGGAALACRALRAREALGAATVAEVEVVAPEALDGKRVLGKAAALVVATGAGERVVHGVVTRFATHATAQRASTRVHEITVESAVGVLARRRQTRVYQHLSVPEIVEKVLARAGLDGPRFAKALTGKHTPRDYVVQFEEDDLSFIRRLCEDDGLYYRFEPRDGFDALVLEDTSTAAPAAQDGPLPLVDEAGLTPDRAVAWACREDRRRRPGKVSLRDYDPQHPAVVLQGSATAGTAVEQGIEVYAAPGGFAAPADGDRRARLVLEGLRAETHRIRFTTSALSLAPGLAFHLAPSPEHHGAARPEGDHVVLAVEHAWRAERAQHEMAVTAIPRAVPFRLPRVTPRPRIAGLHPAVVTGPAGQEIHVDDAGRVKVRFFWDREGPSDDASSLPVRLAQPNLPGSMLIPRVGWEVMVAFEDGDPDRPVVVGRVYNAKHPPPFALPANKTVTSLATASSPGGAKRNSVHFDDAGGRQHMAWAAGTGKTTLVASNMVTQTVGNELCSVGGAQSFAIGANESVSVKAVYVTSAASQSLSVGGSHDVKVGGEIGVQSGSESVLIGGALLEKVGNPVDGAIAFARAAAVTVATMGAGKALEKIAKYGPTLEKLAGYAGHVVAPGIAAVDGGLHDGEKGAALAGAQAVLGQIPGADAIMAAVQGSGQAPWDTPEEKKKGEAAPGGGAAAPGAAADGAAGAAPGHRVHKIGASMTELIGGPHAVMTPGMIRWTTLGASTYLVGGDHNIKALDVSTRTAGASVDVGASLRITVAADIARVVRTGLSRTISGAMSVTAGKDFRLKAGAALRVKVGGALSAKGSVVLFKCGGSTFAATPGGVLIKAPTITINGQVVQKGKASTP